MQKESKLTGEPHFQMAESKMKVNAIMLKLGSILAIVSTFFINSCVCGCGDPTPRYRLTSGEKDLVPYQNGEVVHFQKTSGEVVDVTVERRTISGVFQLSPSEWCGRGQVDLEYDVITFVASDDSLSFPDIQIISRDYEIGRAVFFYQDHEPSEPHLNGPSVCYDENYDLSCSCSSLITCHTVLEVNGLNYTNVIEAETQAHPHENIYINIRTFYNQQVGIIKIIEEFSESWDAPPERTLEYVRM